MKRGTLYGVGVEPEACDWMPLRVLAALWSAPVLALPRNVDHGVSPVWELIRPYLFPAPLQSLTGIPQEQALERQHAEGGRFEAAQERLFLILPNGKAADRPSAPWNDAIVTIRERLVQGLDVTLVSDSDRSLHGIYGDLRREMRSRWPALHTEIIPWATSATLLPSGTSFPLSEELARVAVLHAASDDDDIAEVLGHFDTIVLTEVDSDVLRIAAILERSGLLERSIYLRSATLLEQHVVWGRESPHGQLGRMVVVQKLPSTGTR